MTFQKQINVFKANQLKTNKQRIEGKEHILIN